VEKFLVQYGNASILGGYAAQKFRIQNGEIDPIEEPLNVLSIAENVYACGNSGGALVFGPQGESVPQIGLNIPVVCKLLRHFGITDNPCGAAHLRWSRTYVLPKNVVKLPFGVLIFLRQVVKVSASVGWVEQGLAIKCYLTLPNQPAIEVEGPDKRYLIEALCEA